MTERHTTTNKRPNGRKPDVLSAAAGVAAMFAPAALTGVDPLDVIERALIAAFVTYVGCHGRRWVWIVAAFAVAVPARGFSLVLALLGLVILVAATIPRRRPRAIGAIGVGFTVNAAFWYPPASAPAGPVVAVIAMSLLVASGVSFLRTKRRRAVRITLLVVASYVLVAAIGLAAAMGLAYQHVQEGADASRDALRSARNGDASAAQLALGEAKDSFTTANNHVDGALAAMSRLVPGLAQQADAVRVTVQQGVRITGAADEIVATADYDKLQYQGRLDLAQVRALSGPTARADAVLRDADAQLTDLRSGSLIPLLRTRVDQFSQQIDDARRDTAVATELLRVTPGLFGADGDRRYLIIFVTPAELRGAGGFIGSYAEMHAHDGKVELTRSGRIIDLILAAKPGTRTIAGPNDYLRRYGRFHPEDFLQDDTFSPNFPSSASVIAQLYPQSGGVPVDGVIGVDPTGLAALLELTGPVEVPGLDEPLSASNAVEVLTRTQYLSVPDEAARGEILTEATRVTFDTLTSASLPAPRELADALSPAARAGHLRVWSPKRSEQRTFEKVGADGTLSIPRSSDGLSVVQQNAGNNKLDAYLHRTISYRPTVDAATGKLTAKLRIELRNDVPSTDLPVAVVGNSRGVPVGTNVTWLSIFTRSTVTSATLDGKPISLGPSSERGLNAWDTPLIQIPKGATVTLEVWLAGGVDLTDGYHLRLLPQPVANPDVFSVDLTVRNGVTRSNRTRDALVRRKPIVAPTDLQAPIRRPSN